MKMWCVINRIALFALVLPVALVAVADAPGASPMIGVNFHHDATGQIAASDVVGLVPMAGWQNVDVGSFGNFTGSPSPATSLLLADGSLSGATLADDVPGQNSSTTNPLALPPGNSPTFYRVLLK